MNEETIHSTFDSEDIPAPTRKATKVFLEAARIAFTLIPSSVKKLLELNDREFERYKQELYDVLDNKTQERTDGKLF